MNEWVLAERTHAEIRELQWELAVLPLGATEPHNFHLPYCTDVYEADSLARRACGYAFERGAKALCLPPIPFGVNTTQLEIPGAVTISVTPSTQLKLLGDVVDSLERQKILKLVLVNAHGGNELKPIARELYTRSKVFIAICDLFKLGSDVAKQTFAPGDHADEMETSLMLSARPDLVKLDAAGPGTANPVRFEAVRKGWVSVTRPWHNLTEDTGVGDPRNATPEKGEAFWRVLTERLGSFLVELAKSEMDEKFPFA